MGFSTQAARAADAKTATDNANTRNSITFLPGFPPARDDLFALEHRLALFHECAAAFGVVLALEGILDEFLAEIHVDVVGGLEDLADYSLSPLDRGGRAGGDPGDSFGDQRTQSFGRGD